MYNAISQLILKLNFLSLTLNYYIINANNNNTYSHSHNLFVDIYLSPTKLVAHPSTKIIIMIEKDILNLIN